MELCIEFELTETTICELQLTVWIRACNGHVLFVQTGVAEVYASLDGNGKDLVGQGRLCTSGTHFPAVL